MLKPDQEESKEEFETKALHKYGKPIQEGQFEDESKRTMTKILTSGKTMTVRGIYTPDINKLLKESSLTIDLAQLPIFNESNIFWLEALGEGGCGTVQKAYNKQESEFIAIKRFPNMQESNQEKWAEIMVEHDMLQSIEKIRTNQKENEEYFLKYGGVFRDAKDTNALILQMESGRISLEDILKAGKTYKLSVLMYVHRKLTEGFLLLEESLAGC